jgi:hypothetical protein
LSMYRKMHFKISSGRLWRRSSAILLLRCCILWWCELHGEALSFRLSHPDFSGPVCLYIIQNYSEFKLNLNLTVPPDGRTTRQSDSSALLPAT